MQITEICSGINIKLTMASSGELRIYSDRNQPVAKESDASPHDPNPEAKWYGKTYEGMYNFNYLFPTVDVAPHGDMEGVLTFDGEPDGGWAMNPMYHGGFFPLRRVTAIPAALMDWWENMFFYDDPRASAASFYLRKPLRAGPNEVELQILPSNWSGIVQAYASTPDGDARVAEQAISFRRGIEPTPCASGSDGASHAGGASANGSGSDCRSGNVCRSGGASHAGSLGAALLEALKANIGFILRSIVRDERAPMHGGAHLFYDYDARTFRQKNWLWTYGPSMRTLLVGMKVPEIARAFGAEEMLAAAAGMGEICLRNLETNPAKPFRGLMLCRYEMTPVNSRLGYELKYSPADGLFQAGWGMIPLYRQTGDPRYLRFCSDMADATGELLERDVVVQQDYYAVTGSWKTNTMNESGFGMEGLAELYRETGDKRYRDIGKKYIDQLIGCLETDEGVWARNYFRHSRRVQPPDYATRGMGWAMMGVSSAARMRLGEPYLRKSVAMAEHVMKHQLGNGGWRYVYNSGSDQLGMSEKGTAVWAAMLFRLCRLTGAQRYRDAAGRAVKWLMGAQYLGPDREGHGGVPIIGPQSGIVYRPYYKMACQYTAGFFGLALLESLGAPTEE